MRDPERAVVFQAPSVFPWLSARQNIAIGVNRVYPTATRKEREDVVDYYLERVGLGESADQPARDLSNGTRQLIGIARAFALSPKLLLSRRTFRHARQFDALGVTGRVNGGVVASASHRDLCHA